ncbi:MAG: hypothetical protein IKD45_01330 [Clostridia bacterium]|nr:hypothetical protein [Clostridia bacterium]
MKKVAFLLTIVVIFSVLTLTGCKEKNREYDEAEVKAAALLLIPKSEILNEMYWGFGIAHDGNRSEANGKYYKADFLSAAEFGVETVEDMKRLTRECFSESYSNLIISTKLSAVQDEDGNMIAHSRYYQKYNVLDGSEEYREECIMVDSEAKVLLDDELSYDYDTLTVSHSIGDSVIVKITVTVTESEGKSQTKELEISLVEEADGWRINSPTYTTYFDRADYDEIQNKLQNGD